MHACTLRVLALVAAAASAACGSPGGNGPADAADVSETGGEVFLSDGMAGDIGPDGEDASPPDTSFPDIAPEVMADTAQLPDTALPPEVIPDIPVEPDIPPPPDSDGDGVPDAYDPFPNDPQMPGVASVSTVYMHTSTELYSMDVKLYKVTLVGAFDWGGFWSSDEMTDIAIDRWGVLYGISFGSLYVCNPQTAVCKFLGDLPAQFNGLTVIPAGVIEPDDEVLIGVSEDGGWYRLDVVGTQVVSTWLGSYGGNYGSSGDAYSIFGVGTFATVNTSMWGDDTVVEVDPATGKVLQEVASLTGYSSTFGLAGWTDRAFAFDESGVILIVDTTAGTVESELKSSDLAWWGAGVRTVIQ
jgi:hypothetical protein